VGQGALEQGGIGEGVAELGFELGDRGGAGVHLSPPPALRATFPIKGEEEILLPPCGGAVGEAD
jgi:hypothetical protein